MMPGWNPNSSGRRLFAVMVVWTLCVGMMQVATSAGTYAESGNSTGRWEDVSYLLSRMRTFIPGETVPFIREGQRGEQVLVLQHALRAAVGSDLSPDGIFGPRTRRAVREFQRAQQLRVDGVIGPKTWKSLQEVLTLKGTMTSHVVRPGETLAAIGRQYGRSWQDIASFNGLANPHVLAVGTELRIPGTPKRTDASELSENPKEAPHPQHPQTKTDPGQQSEGTSRPSPPESATSEVSEAAPEASQTRAQSDTPSQGKFLGPAALTFNGGPDPNITPELLDLLAAHGIRATFFFDGRAAQDAQELVRRAARENHQIETRGWSGEPASKREAAAIAEELERSRNLLARLAGREPTFYRPPGALVTSPVIEAARRAHLQIVFWTNIGAEDRNGVSPSQLRQRLQRSMYPGAILMLRADSRRTLEALSDLLPIWKQDGVEFLVLDDLFRLGATWPTFAASNSRP